MSLLSARGQDKDGIRVVSGSEIVHSLVWESKLYRQIEFLSDSLCGGRATGTRGGVEAASWIARRYRQIGLMPLDSNYARHFSTFNGLVGRNVLGLLPGSLKSPRQGYIIVAAHYDGLGTIGDTMYPGADSNASGVVAMLGIAEMMKAMMRFGKSYARSVLFVALDAKEISMRGSYALWELLESGELHDPLTGQPILPEKVSKMVNIDQIGSSLSPLRSGSEDFLIMLPGQSQYLGSFLMASNLQWKTDLEIATDYYGSKDFTTLFYNRISDQKVFAEHGKEAVLFTSGITMNNNKTTDTPDSLNLEVLKKRIWLIFHWLEKII